MDLHHQVDRCPRNVALERMRGMSSLLRRLHLHPSTGMRGERERRTGREDVSRRDREATREREVDTRRTRTRRMEEDTPTRIRIRCRGRVQAPPRQCPRILMTCPHRRVLLCQGATPTRVRRPRPCHRRQVRSTQARVRVTSRSARPSRALARLLTGAGGGLVGSLRARRRVWCTRTRIRGSSHPCRHICRCTVVIAFPRLRQGDMTLSLRPLDSARGREID